MITIKNNYESEAGLISKFFTIAFLLTVNVFSSFGTGITFEPSYASALNKAKQTNKIVFIYIYTTWCGPCKLLSSTVFVDAKVGALFNASFVNARVDADKQENIANAFDVDAYPTLLFLDRNGQMMMRHVGTTDVDGLLDLAGLVKNFYSNRSKVLKGIASTTEASDYLTILHHLDPSKADNLSANFLDSLNVKEPTTWPLVKRHVHGFQSKSFAFVLTHAAHFTNAYKDDFTDWLEGIRYDEWWDKVATPGNSSAVPDFVLAAWTLDSLLEKHRSKEYERRLAWMQYHEEVGTIDDFFNCAKTFLALTPNPEDYTYCAYHLAANAPYDRIDLFTQALDWGMKGLQGNDIHSLYTVALTCSKLGNYHDALKFAKKIDVTSLDDDQRLSLEKFIEENEAKAH